MQERTHFALDERVESGRGLVEDDEIRTAHERLDESEFLAIPLGELADRTIEDNPEAVAEPVSQRFVN